MSDNLREALEELAEDFIISFEGGQYAAVRLRAILAAHPDETTTASLRFNFQYTDWSIDPYYVRYWDKAKPISVNAETKAEALTKARTILGEPPRGRTWALRTISIEAAS